ncbi:AMP-binding protein [Saccharothrix isguenensis]
MRTHANLTGPAHEAAQVGVIHHLLDEAVAEVPHARAVTDSTGSWTYRELDLHSHAAATWLRDRGVRPGDRVVVQAATTRQLVGLFFGASRCGAVFVPLNPTMKAFHLSSVLANADPVLVVGGDNADLMRSWTNAPVSDVDDMWDGIAQLEGGRAPAEDVTPDLLAALVYTSGSTAAPKAVMLPHAQVVFATLALTDALGYRADDVVFCRFQLSWDYGLYKVLMTAAARCEVVLAGEESDLGLLRRMRETNTTVLPIVPSLGGMIATLARREVRLPPLRLITNTGAALSAATTDALRACFRGVQVVRQFGQTECKRITVMPPDQDRDRPLSVGKPLPGTTVRILDAGGDESPVGEIGEIVVSGPHVMPGYWRAPELTERTFRRDRDTGELCLHTGDYGFFDDDGYLYFTGRRDDMFKRKGIRMSTVEIETAAMDIAGVQAAAAVPPVDARDLAIVVAGDLEPHVVLKELATRLEPQKVPAFCRVVDAVPLTQHGKNSRQSLVAMLDGGNG